jgi:hypothetical protein
LGRAIRDVTRKTRRNGTATEERKTGNGEASTILGVQGKLSFAHGMATFKNTLSPSGNATNSGYSVFLADWNGDDSQLHLIR